MRAILLKDDKISEEWFKQALASSEYYKILTEIVIFDDEKLYKCIKSYVPHIKTTHFQIDWKNNYPPYFEGSLIKNCSHFTGNILARENMESIIIGYSDMIICFHSERYISGKEYSLCNNAHNIEYPTIYIHTSNNNVNTFNLENLEIQYEHT